MDEDAARSYLDRAAVGQVLRDYAWGIDRKDMAAIRLLLAPDARARYGAERAWLNDADSIIAMLSATVEPAGWQQHTVVVENVELEGATATARASLSAYQTMTADPSTLVTVLGRYHARFRRDGNGWLLTELDLDHGWVERRTASG